MDEELNVLPVAEGTDASNDARLKSHDFVRLSSFINQYCGINLPPAKKTLLESRLRKRLRALGMKSYAEYCDLIMDPERGASEFVHTIDEVTTNKTDFFRESKHFDYLVAEAVPTLVSARGAGVERELRVWSAACSSGEEPYTLAMVLTKYGQRVPGFDFSILGTDINTEVLQHARRAVYEEERAEPIPADMKRVFLMRSRDRSSRAVRIVPALRSLVEFRQLNFLEEDYGLAVAMDVVFCRNALIYFNRKTQEAILKHICRHVVPNGYVFLGHSETINGLNLPLEPVAPTVYLHVP